MTTIISAIFGGYDAPKLPVPQSNGAKWVLVTDDANLTAPGWDSIHVVGSDGTHPRMQAKWPKLRPWDFAPDDTSWIWIDGSMQVMSTTFAEEALDSAFGALSQWEHPNRDDIWAEAQASHHLAKYAGVPVLEQAGTYIQNGHPRHWGLWATGVIVYRSKQGGFADRWMGEMVQWGYQDQISQPVALRCWNLRPSSLPHTLTGNPWVRIVAHADGTC